ncbi:uncharacterized protein LOC115327565 [Ixodes scapularis]|uniref:uncharacterized protein LOC115327565 n=1 Tax=Ixodes scapularis TaxID=6945 RepID=UPI001A9EFC23|nr:uncharacterized protein LOC115327565 [Ixodes scapularis]
MVSSTALLLSATACIFSASLQLASAERCSKLDFPTSYGIFECAGKDINLCSSIDFTELQNMNKLVDCTINGLTSLGYNGYLFSNLEPLIADIFTNLINISGAETSLETLAHYCDTHQNENFCQVPALANAKCSTPVKVNVPKNAKKDWAINYLKDAEDFGKSLIHKCKVIVVVVIWANG